MRQQQIERSPHHSNWARLRHLLLTISGSAGCVGRRGGWPRFSNPFNGARHQCSRLADGSALRRVIITSFGWPSPGSSVSHFLFPWCGGKHASGRVKRDRASTMKSFIFCDDPSCRVPVDQRAVLVKLYTVHHKMTHTYDRPMGSLERDISGNDVCFLHETSCGLHGSPHCTELHLGTFDHMICEERTLFFTVP